MDVLILIVIAIIPPIGFLFYINSMDRIEPEPYGLIIKAMLLGALAVIPAAIAEYLLYHVPALAAEGIADAAIKSFVVISPVEEICKLGVVLLFIWNNKNFNEENDGIVYMGAAAIGFSLLENILYVVQSGLGTGIMRAMTSIPLHTFTGVLMGYFVGIAKFSPTGKGRIGNIVFGFFIAYLVHAVYDTLALSGTGAALLIIPLVIVLVIFGVIHMKKGTRLSFQRWRKNALAADPAAAALSEPVEAPSPAVYTGTGTYKIVISRILFFICAAFWALLIIGMLSPVAEDQEGPLALIIGGFILTFIPVTIGLVLELSYRRQKKSMAVAA